MRVALHYVLWRCGWARAETQTTERERACLARHAAGRHRLVEVGVFQGVTTRVLRQAMPPDATLFAVDPFFTGRLGVSFHRWIAEREVGEIDNGEVCWLITTGAEAAEREEVAAGGPVDFVFIDGDHSWEGISGDWQGWSPRIAGGGILALHDSRQTDGADSERFTRQVILADSRFGLIDEVDRLTVLRRRLDD